jgi:DNA-binding MarR family transcriptional regulator
MSLARDNSQSGAESRGQDAGNDSTLQAPLTPEACAAEITDVVPLVNRFMRSHVSQHLDSLSSLAQLRAVGFLLRCPGASLSELANHLAVTKATASTMVDRMVQHGLLTREEDPNERRYIILNATTTGAQHYERARALAQSAVAQVISHLSEQKLRAVFEGLAALREAFSSETLHQHK